MSELSPKTPMERKIQVFSFMGLHKQAFNLFGDLLLK